MNYLLYSQHTLVCRCLCVYLCMYALTIVSPDKVLRCINTYCYWSLLCSAILLISALEQALCVHVICDSEQVTCFIAHIFNIHWNGVLTALFVGAWLVPHEAAAISAQVLCPPFILAPIRLWTVLRASWVIDRMLNLIACEEWHLPPPPGPSLYQEIWRNGQQYQHVLALRALLTG